MSTAKSICAQYTEIWDSMKSHWRGEGCSLFEKNYVHKTKDAALVLDADCTRLEGLTDEFSEELSALEQQFQAETGGIP